IVGKQQKTFYGLRIKPAARCPEYFRLLSMFDGRRIHDYCDGWLLARKRRNELRLVRNNIWRYRWCRINKLRNWRGKCLRRRITSLTEKRPEIQQTCKE